MVGPRDYTEHVIVQVFRSTLGRPELTRHSDFFDEGGSSLHRIIVTVSIATRYRQAGEVARC